MEENQSRNSVFVSLPGLSGLLVLAVTASYFHAVLISAFLFLLFLLCLCSYAWSRGVCKRVLVEVTAPAGTCHAGENCVVEMKVRNNSFFPLVWLDVILPTGSKPLIRPSGEEDFSWFWFKGREEAQTGVRERFVWLLWQQEISWKEELKAEKRGAVQIDGAGLQAGDGFGLSAKEEWYGLENPVRLLIYPKLVPVKAGRFLKITQEAVARNHGQTEDITILKSSRPYQPGDPMKKINWRQLARSGRMTVNVYETVMPGCAAFILDLGSFRTVVEKQSTQGGTVKETFVTEKALEQMISLIASCMKELAERQIWCALILPGYGARDAKLVVPSEGDSVLQECMEELALIDYQAEEALFPYEEFWQAGHKLGNVYICARSEESSGFQDLAFHLGRSRASYLVSQKGNGGAGEFDCLYAEEICPAFGSCERDENAEEKEMSGRDGQIS